MILFLEDCIDRTRIFRGFFPEAICTASSKSMIQLLSRVRSARFLFLDHDLENGIEGYVHGKIDGTGMEVVEWLERNRFDVYQVVVHSCNGFAAPLMLERLLKVNYNAVACPFYDLLPQLAAYK